MDQLFEQRDDASVSTPKPTMAIMIGNGRFDMNAVGTAEHQDELASIVGGRTEAGADFLCGALLVPDSKNPFDPHAIAVSISSRVIGYLQPDAGPSLKLALRAGAFVAVGCAAKIVGGARHANGEQEDFDVRLDASVPFRMRSIAKETTPSPLPPFAAPPPFAPSVRQEPIARVEPVARTEPFARTEPERDLPIARLAARRDVVVARPVPERDSPLPWTASDPDVVTPRITPDRDVPIARPVPQIDPYALADRVSEPEEVKVPPPRGRFVALILDLVLIVAILAGGFWWAQRLPREPAATEAPAPAPAMAPVEPAPAPPEQTPSVWQSIPLPNMAPPPATEPPAQPATSDPAPPPAAGTPPTPRSKPEPQKARPKTKAAAPKAEPANAPLQLH